MSATTSSSISSTSYQSVTHKKNLGTIILNDANFTFYPAAAAASAAAKLNPTKVVAVWVTISKHQVSPITLPRFLLKIILLPSSDAHIIASASASSSASALSSVSKSTKSTSFTFELKSRDQLERIRQDISTRLTGDRRRQAQNALQIQPNHAQNLNRKRGLEEMNGTSTELSASVGEPKRKQSTSNTSSSFTVLTDTSLAVTCSSLLSTDSTLRMHYILLVLGQPPPSNAATNTIIDFSKLQLTPILSETDFWFTHKTILANHSAKINGTVSCGLSSAMKSSLDLLDIGTRKPIHLGVEEMRQIFILYPAVHKAYEAMVPLELSEEQFWRKYLESEYFHRDRGRLGTHFEKRIRMPGSLNLDKKDEDGELHQQPINSKEGSGDGSNAATSTNANTTAASGGGSGTSSANNGAAANATAIKKIGEEAKTTEENARVAAASSSDIFSRAELELQKRQPEAAVLNHTNSAGHIGRKGNVHLAIGQFDLAATANTERGSKLLLYCNDSNRPSNEDTKGSKVIEKYNRHWAIVMNPEIATAGCNLMDLARGSVEYILEGDEDAKVAGGVGKEMERLVGFASAREGRVDHVKGLGDPDNDDKTSNGKGKGGSYLFQELKLQSIPANSDQLGNGTGQNDNLSALPVLNSVMEYNTLRATKEGNSFPKPEFGHALLLNLTKKMKMDSVTESDTIKMTNQLDENFRNKLILYFRRATELLKHFFALRRVMETEKRFGKSRESAVQKSSDKITKVVDCMKQVYREIDEMRNDLPDETMRDMSFTIMKQLDFAFTDTSISGGGDGGGFVTVKD